uniref:Hedgehog/Intein (Hint) domain-containing protein n=1 Tax=viral metagenome TaxID=1070528 RepID=A0A6C0JF28_9ZZZZ
MTTTRYYIRLTLPDSGDLVIFTGFFDVDDSTHIVQTFYDSINPTVDIRSTGNNGGPTYLYYPGWLCFDGGGCNITSFPYLYGATTGDYNMYGNTGFSTGNFVNGIGNITYEFSLIPYSGFPCFKEGTMILTDKGYRSIQELRKGDLIETYKHGLKPIDMIGKRPLHHVCSEERIKDQLYVCRVDQYPEITEELVITGCHSVLVDRYVDQEQRSMVTETLGKIYLTDGKARLPACVDKRATVYEKKGTYTIYHIALEHDDYFMNYGVYANGLLVETSSKRYLKELSNMELIE